MNSLPKYVAIKGNDGLYLNGHTLEMETSPFPFRVTENSHGLFHFQGLSTGNKVDTELSSEAITFYENELIWKIEQIGSANKFVLRESRTNQFLSALGKLQDLPYEWSIENMVTTVEDAQNDINIYVANTVNVVKRPDGQLTSADVQAGSEDQAAVQHKINQLVNVAGKEGISKWKKALLPTGVPIRSLTNANSDSLTLFYSPDLSVEAKKLLPSNRLADDFSQIIVKYFSAETVPAIDTVQENVNYTTLLIEKSPNLAEEGLLDAFLNGYQKTAELSYDGKMSDGLTEDDAVDISDNMDSATFRLNMKPLANLYEEELDMVSQSQTGEDVKNFLVDTFISQVPASAIDAMWFFGINKVFVIDARFNNFSSKPCNVSIQYFDNIDKGKMAIDPSIPQGIKAVTKEGENVSIPGLPIPVENTEDTTGYANYVLTNNNHFLEGCSILLVFDFEDTEEKLFVSVDVPISKASKINADFRAKDTSYKDIFKSLNKHASLSKNVESDELNLNCEVTLNAAHHAPDDTYITVINLKDN